MSFLPGFDDDIFISYSHIDDRPLTEGQQGWISIFHHALATRLAQLLVPEPGVWRDPKLQGNDIFEDKLMGRIPKSAVLTAVVWRTTHKKSAGAPCVRRYATLNIEANPFRLETSELSVSDLLVFIFIILGQVKEYQDLMRGRFGRCRKRAAPEIL
jgi:hypothetical protein